MKFGASSFYYVLDVLALVGVAFVIVYVCLVDEAYAARGRVVA